MALIELPRERQMFLSELAEEVWQTHSRERQVFLDGIANAMEVTLSYGDYGDAFDGLLEHRRSTFHIYCNTARGQPCNSPRARFTVAHELGHFFIDEHRNALLAGKPAHYSFTDQPADNPVEAEANHFAASLLMPTTEYRNALLETRPGLCGIIDTASTFNVSVQSSALRFTAISRRPCAIVMIRDTGKTWWYISPELRLSGYQWMLKVKSESIPTDSATGKAMQNSTFSFGPIHQNGTIASAWFGGINKGSRRDETFIESAVRLGGRGVLVMLEPSSLQTKSIFPRMKSTCMATK
jgi:hypothetical protein